MKDYIYTSHSLDMIKEREIKDKWIEDTLTNPDNKEEKEGTVHYIKKIADNENRILRIIVNSKVTP